MRCRSLVSYTLVWICIHINDCQVSKIDCGVDLLNGTVSVPMMFLICVARSCPSNVLLIDIGLTAVPEPYEVLCCVVMTCCPPSSSIKVFFFLALPFAFWIADLAALARRGACASISNCSSLDGL